VVGLQDQFEVQSQVYNLDPLYGISFQVMWSDSTMIQMDSAVLASQYSPSDVIFFERALTGRSHVFTVTHTQTGGNLVGTSGPTGLATLYFSEAPGATIGFDTALIEVITSSYTPTSADTAITNPMPASMDSSGGTPNWLTCQMNTHPRLLCNKYRAYEIVLMKTSGFQRKKGTRPYALNASNTNRITVPAGLWLCRSTT